MKEYRIPLTLLQATINYLQSKPHKEVFEQSRARKEKVANA